MAGYEYASPLRYRGQPYRSQAEGFWARLMDQVGIRYQYEPVTVEFPDGRRYNPDFFLTGVKRYLEIKNYLPGTSSAVKAHDSRLANDLARCTGTQVTLIDGRPAQATAYVFDGRPPEADWEGAPDPLSKFAFRRLSGGSNAVPILHELIQPSGHEASVTSPRHFVYNSKNRIKNLPISFDGELEFHIGPEAFAAQNEMLGRRAPTRLAEPAVLPVDLYEAHPRRI